MIEVNELRIGNIVEFKDPLTNEVERIEIDSDDFDLIYKKNNGHRYFPIPLSPEILEKAGFVEMANDVFVNTNFGFIVCIRRGAKENSWVYGDRNTDQLSTFFYYVHQLQNLVFALTGTDLSLQL